MTATEPALRVATVPSRHAYLDAALPADAVRVPVPEPAGGPWAPSTLLTAGGLALLDPRTDLLHLHFGFDHLSTGELRGWTRRLAGLGVPLVLTVHDLRNPHHDDPRPHDEHLDVLVPAAAEVLTLTPAAAAVIADRWGRTATVVGHPAVLPPDPDPVPTEPGLVGVHLKSLRRNVVEPDRVVRAVLAGAVAGGGHLRVDVHPDVLDDPRLGGVRALAAAGHLDLQVHQRFTDAELARHLQQLHVSVLPHRFGTHSGWLEACRDAGTAVVAPSCGPYPEQWSAVRTARHDERSGLDEDSLADAVRAAVTAAPPAPADPGWRAEQREQVRAAHAAVYRRAARTRTVPA